jgi:hypothetical protein
VLELSGVFGGRLSFSRSAAFSASTAASCLLNSSIRANNRAISASFSALDSADESKGGVTHMLTYIRPPEATAVTLIESICRTCHVGGLSNYLLLEPHRHYGAIENHSFISAFRRKPFRRLGEQIAIPDDRQSRLPARSVVDDQRIGLAQPCRGALN